MTTPATHTTRDPKVYRIMDDKIGDNNTLIGVYGMLYKRVGGSAYLFSPVDRPDLEFVLYPSHVYPLNEGEE